MRPHARSRRIAATAMTRQTIRRDYAAWQFGKQREWEEELTIMAAVARVLARRCGPRGHGRDRAAYASIGRCQGGHASLLGLEYTPGVRLGGPLKTRPGHPRRHGADVPAAPSQALTVQSVVAG